MEYVIIYSEEKMSAKSACEDLEAQVQAYIDKGWKPLGGVFFTQVTGLYTTPVVAAQAMTKEYYKAEANYDSGRAVQPALTH